MHAGTVATGGYNGAIALGVFIHGFVVDTSRMHGRFDLLHVMIDEPDDILDYRVAQHIVSVHQRQVEGQC